MRYRCAVRISRLVATIPLFAAAAGAQQQPGALPPVRQLGRRVAVTTEPLGTVQEVRALSNGTVLLNDIAKHRVELLDSLLSHPIAVADSSRNTGNAYGPVIGGLIPYRADTTLFADGASLSLVVIDPAGKIVRVMAPPHPADLGSFLTYLGGRADFDAQGRIVYEITGMSIALGSISWVDAGPGVIAARHGLNLDGTPSQSPEDSIPIVRVDLVTRATDTVGFVTTWRSPTPPPVPAGGGTPTQRIVLYPFKRSADGWAVAADGSIAIVRAQDYHIDWTNADGTHSSTPKIAHEWRRITDSAKEALVDSIRSALKIQQAHMDSGALARHTPLSAVQRPEVVDASELPDYESPFGSWPVRGSPPVMSDADNNLWIRQGAAAPPARPDGSPAPPPVYDVVNRQGTLIDRVQMPPSLTLIGFGPGVAYFAVREGMGTVVAKYRIR